LLTALRTPRAAIELVDEANTFSLPAVHCNGVHVAGPLFQSARGFAGKASDV
jgi:hypothetical protein